MSVWYEEGKGFCIQKVITDGNSATGTIYVYAR